MARSEEEKKESILFAMNVTMLQFLCSICACKNQQRRENLHPIILLNMNTKNECVECVHVP